MTILKNVEMWWVKLDPKRPSPAFGDAGPKWEFQARTSNKAQRDEWKAANINIKLVEDEKTGTTYYKTDFRKPTTKKDGTPQLPVKVVNGSLEEINPNTIGNGSICSIRLFQYDFEVKSGKPGGPVKKGIASMLMSVQVTKHVKYVPKEREDDFEMTETEVVEPADNQSHDADDNSFSEVSNSGAAADPNF